MTRQSEPRRRPGHACLAPPPAVVALPAPAGSCALQGLAPAEPPCRHPQVAPARTRAVPAIAIHAFCEMDGTSAALEAARADRRLAKAHLEVSAGGLAAAIADRAEARAPDLLVVETTLPRSEMLERLGALTERLGPATKVMLIGHVNDITLYRKLMRRGICDYLVAPVSPDLFVDAVAGLFGAACEAQVGRIIAFIAAKGGAGSSTVCHNAAWAMSELLKSEVVVADLDLAFGTAGLDFNQDAQQGAADALHAPERLDEALLDRLVTRCSQHLGILAAPAALDRDYDITVGACRGLLDALRHHAAFTALDLPHAWAPWVKQALLTADDIVITAAPDLANLRNARNLVDLLEAGRLDAKPPRLVINMARRRKRPDVTVEEFASALDLEPALIIEFDADTFGLAANNGQMIGEFSRKARAAQQFRELALALAQRSEPKEAARPSPLAPIFDKLGLRGQLL